MITKTIKFNYTGGEYTQNFNIQGTNLPWTYECSDSWIGITSGAASLKVKVGQIYGFNTRKGVVKVFDRFKNEIDLIIEQSGYCDLSVEMPSNIVLYETYYDKNQTYDVYLTVYGGPTQEILCEGLKPYIQKVWDNSDMYNDFILRIPQSLNGEFEVKHSDCDSFKEYCEKEGIEYPEGKLEKHISITQVSLEDTVGKMVIECDGKKYTNSDEIFDINVYYDKPTFIKIVSTAFIVVDSKTTCHTVTNSPVSLVGAPDWLDVEYNNNTIKLKCRQKNNLDNRACQICLENTKNSRQNIKITLKQRSGN